MSVKYTGSINNIGYIYICICVRFILVSLIIPSTNHRAEYHDRSTIYNYLARAADLYFSFSCSSSTSDWIQSRKGIFECSRASITFIICRQVQNIMGSAHLHVLLLLSFSFCASLRLAINQKFPNDVARLNFAAGPRATTTVKVFDLCYRQHEINFAVVVRTYVSQRGFHLGTTM